MTDLPSSALLDGKKWHFTECEFCAGSSRAGNLSCRRCHGRGYFRNLKPSQINRSNAHGRPGPKRHTI